MTSPCSSRNRRLVSPGANTGIPSTGAWIPLTLSTEGGHGYRRAGRPLENLQHTGAHPCLRVRALIRRRAEGDELTRDTLGLGHNDRRGPQSQLLQGQLLEDRGPRRLCQAENQERREEQGAGQDALASTGLQTVATNTHRPSLDSRATSVALWNVRAPGRRAGPADGAVTQVKTGPSYPRARPEPRTLVCVHRRPAVQSQRC